jgi:DNA-binding response OmpR family regulator
MESILIVDDDVNLCAVLQEELIDIGFKTNSVYSAEDAFRFIEENHIDLMLLDLKMPGKDGFDVLEYYRNGVRNFKIIVLTAYADVKSAIKASEMGASDFLSKPYDFDELLISIRKVLQEE